MAAGVLPEPGSELGPCVPECKHIDCAETRAIAESACCYCSKPIGYGVRYYRDPNPARLRWSHARCVEAAGSLKERGVL